MTTKARPVMEDNPKPIRGNVRKRSDNSAVQGASINLHPHNSGIVIASTSSDNNGEFYLGDFIPGIYDIEAICSTCPPELVSVEVKLKGVYELITMQE